ncbi:hypothetical protein [Ilyobacter polytropus]|uniref:Uncharacterized protein n=1 Tax=Ilyobacter polytropus (strain ATCC 51220 / DSM 2926 / LMG 16218 / CuHBu1) TaxID=572544 RepID=E3H8D8_ILYPC|nr:hypothetical protein [Ilyobacter polytropus]ADO82705.1 hypothetical protein Ilyop_0922 [Ilyobacter polytropus DSM 2926]
MLNKISRKKIDALYKKEGFENQFEKTKKVGLELILSVQKFTMDPTKKKLENIKNCVADYWILCKQILRNAPREELKYLVKLNNSFEKTITDLDLKHIYSNIMEKYKGEIIKITENKLKDIKISITDNSREFRSNSSLGVC